MKAARIVLIVLLFCLLAASITIPSLAQYDDTTEFLYHDLTACWDLDEASGIRYDDVGGANLTDVNTVGSDAGQSGAAASFVRTNSEQLQSSHRAAFTAGSHDWTIVLWFYPRYTTSGTIVSHWGYPNYEYALSIVAGDLRLSKSPDGQTVSYTSIGTVSANNWYWLAIWQDATAQKIYWQLWDDTPSEADWPGFYNGSGAFYIGSSGGNYFDGLVDVVAIWHRVLSDYERNYIFYDAMDCSLINNVPPTPTPGVERRVDLTSGDWAMVRREVSYGDVMLTGLVGLLVSLILVGFGVWAVERWFGGGK